METRHALLRSSAILLTALILIAGRSEAQATKAEIFGTAHDPAGRAVPSAHVELRNVSTGTVVAALSNWQGYYHFLAVPAGMENSDEMALNSA